MGLCGLGEVLEVVCGEKKRGKGGKVRGKGEEKRKGGERCGDNKGENPVGEGPAEPASSGLSPARCAA